MHGSVVDAVECAVSLQRGLAERNAAAAQAGTEPAVAGRPPVREGCRTIILFMTF
jgi:hypothetical protein